VPKSQSSSKRLSRRQYIKYAGAGIAAAAIAGLGYYATRPSPPQIQITQTQITSSIDEEQRELALREQYSSLFPPQKLHVGIKGVCYSVGIGELSHPYRVSDETMRKDIEAIHDELGCNGIRIYGETQERMIKCAEMALDSNFDAVLLLPFYVEATHQQLVREVGKLAKAAAELAESWGDRIVMMIGAELTVSSVGIYPGGSYWARSMEIARLQNNKEYQKKLEVLVRDLIDASRVSFSGKLCYGAGPWEWWLPWNELDLHILGDQHYWYREYGNWEDPENVYFRHIKHYKRYHKPYFNTEFGSSCFQGAFDWGAGAWMEAVPGANVCRAYDEDGQAESVRRYMEMFNKAHEMGLTVDGCFLFRYFGGLHPPLEGWKGEPYCRSEDMAIVVPEYSTTLGNPPIDHWRKAFYMYKSYQRVS